MSKRTTVRGAQLSVLASAVSAVLFSGGINQALAQEQENDEANNVEEEVIVTGTRIRRDDFTTPNAVATLTAEEMKDLGIVSVADMMLQMTSNVASASLDTTGDGSFFVGATLANLRGVNTGFGTRTLTLVDGRRMPATTNGGGVDLSMIPAVLVGRMETVTGGAGATYGSDAMAGVVNIILDRNIEGTRIQAGYYTTAEGDGDQYNFSLANGTYVLDRRGHVTVGFEHQTIDPILNCHEARDWCRRSFNYLDSNDNPNNNPYGSGFFAPPYPDINDPRAYPDELPPIINPAFPGGPRYQIVEDVRYIHTSPYGSLHTENDLPADPWNGIFAEFTEDGLDIVPYQESLTGVMREYAYGGANRRVVGGEGKLYSHGHNLRNGSVRNNFYTRFNYDFNDRLSANVEVMFSRNNGENKQMRPGFMREGICVRNDNAFIQPELGMTAQAREVLMAREASCSIHGSIFQSTPGGRTVYKDFSGLVDRGVKTETEMTRIVLGANGGLFGSDNWTWDTYLQYGETDRYQLLYNNKTNFRYGMAIDAVIDDETGEVVCRINSSQGLVDPPGPGVAHIQSWINYFQGTLFSTSQQAAAVERVNDLRRNCVPLNPFGLAASPEALAYAYDDLIEFTKTDNTVLSASFSGSFWKGFGAGPARLAAGIDYREDNTDNDTGGDPSRWVRTDFSAQYGDPWTGGTEVSDVFAEVEIPLLRGKPGAEYMMVNFSNRRSKNTTFRNDAEESLSVDRYSDSYKFSWVWNPVDWMTVRTTRSADIRQPAARELFYRQTFQGGGYFGATNPWRETDRNGDTWDTIIGANPNLRNEESITETLGLVFQPGGWGRGLSFAVDYVELNIKGGISYATGSDPENEENLPYPIFRCYQYNDPYYCDLIEFGEELQPGNPYSNITSVTTTQENSEPYWTRAVDFTVRYQKQLSQGGSFSIRLLATKNLEQNICTDIVRTSPTETICNERENVVGQTGGRVGSTNVLVNYTPTPNWSGNLFGTYRKNAWSVTAQARYTGSALGSIFWVGPDDPRFGPDRHFTISRNYMPSWTTWNTTFNYDFSRSRFASSRFNEMSLSLTIDNLFDRQPGFWSGGNIAGVNTRFYSGMGRSYRLNYTMAF